jgi:hypothetical protein
MQETSSLFLSSPSPGSSSRPRSSQPELKLAASTLPALKNFCIPKLLPSLVPPTLEQRLARSLSAAFSVAPTACSNKHLGNTHFSSQYRQQYAGSSWTRKSKPARRRASSWSQRPRTCSCGSLAAFCAPRPSASAASTLPPSIAVHSAKFHCRPRFLIRKVPLMVRKTVNMLAIPALSGSTLAQSCWTLSP